MKLITLILSLPTENATVRMRAWRSLKAAGAAVLRDGVYLMPELASSLQTLNHIADDVQAAGGMAFVFHIAEPTADDFVALFDRSDEYASLMAEIVQIHSALNTDTVRDASKQTRKLRKNWAALCEIDFFPGAAQQQTSAALQELELSIARTLSPDEPQAGIGEIAQLLISEYQGRVWATRARPWVDRLASAWLILRFIDPQARFLWLASPADCPTDALGFDFDGARFSHVQHRVTFEVLLASFSLQATGLKRLAALVHYLDVGGIAPPEATGIESVLAGMRAAINDDDQLLRTVCSVFDGLLNTFAQGSSADE